MAQAVADAMVDGEHLLVQAGTGTGKSLAYLVPSLLHDQRVVVATATLALQHQLVERDLPRLVEALEDHPASTRRTPCSRAAPTTPACTGSARASPDDQGVLVDVPEGSMGKKVLELRTWAEKQAEDGGSRRARRRPAPHRPASGARSASATASASARQVPLRDGVLRRASPARRRTAPT